MDEFALRISLLIKITNKKKEYLELIKNITYNQNSIVIANEIDSNSRQLFMNLAKEKQTIIDEVYNLDTVFQRTYNSIKHLFNNSLSKEYKLKLKELQSIIDNIILLDKQICEIESNNSDLLENKKKTLEKNTSNNTSEKKEAYLDTNLNGQDILNKSVKNTKTDIRVQNANLNKAIAQYKKQDSNYVDYELFKNGR